MSELRIVRANANDISALHGILTICGEHYHRVHGLDHWYPFRDMKTFMKDVDTDYIYGIYDGDFLIGTFNLNPRARPYYPADIWMNADAKAWYLGGFAILPYKQGGGIGRWVMQQVDALTQAKGYDALRFDGVATNTPLMRFYDQLQYDQRGIVKTPSGNAVMCYERNFR